VLARKPCSCPIRDVAQLGDALGRSSAKPQETRCNVVHCGGAPGRGIGAGATQDTEPKLIDGALSRPDPKDAGVSAPSWGMQPVLFFVAPRAHAAACRSVLELIDPPALTPLPAKKAPIAGRLTARRAGPPTNFLPTNPSCALKAAFETAAHLLKGARNFSRRTLRTRWPSATLDSLAVCLRSGRTPLPTPGKVVYSQRPHRLSQSNLRLRGVHAAPAMHPP